MTHHSNHELDETLQDPFPSPKGFSRLTFWRRESTPSLALTLLVAAVIAVLVLWAMKVIHPDAIASAEVVVEQVSLNEDDQKALDLETTQSPSPVEAQQESVEEPVQVEQVEPESAEVPTTELAELEPIPAGSSDDGARAVANLSDALKKSKRPKPRSVASPATPSQKNASGGTPSGRDLQQRLSQAGAKTGDIQISLAWNNGNDLDLIVATPSGELVFYNHPRSSCGGSLDVDRNAGGSQTNRPVENIYWAEGRAPKGRYRVMVLHYRNWGGRDPTAFRVRVKVDGKVRDFSGQVSPPRRPKLIYTFTRR